MSREQDLLKRYGELEDQKRLVLEQLQDTRSKQRWKCPECNRHNQVNKTYVAQIYREGRHTDPDGIIIRHVLNNLYCNNCGAIKVVHVNKPYERNPLTLEWDEWVQKRQKLFAKLVPIAIRSGL